MDCKAAQDETRGGEFIRVGDLLIRAVHVKLLRQYGLTSLDSLFGYADGEVLGKPGLADWRERIRMPLNWRGRNVVFYLKRYTRPPASEQREQRWTCAAAASTAGVEWQRMLELTDAGISCPQPVAFGEEVCGGRELRSAVLIEEVPGESLENWIKHWSPPPGDITRFLSVHLARLVGRLHSRGFVHRDLYLSHVFFDSAAPVEQSLYLIDVQRVMRPRWRHLRWIIKDLAALNHSTPAGIAGNGERLRWLRRYLCAARFEVDVRWLRRRVAAKTRRMARHDRRRAARLQPRSRTP